MVMHRRRGFTLIELLVVIAIIGILAAMLFPVFARARESARKTQCLANIKNIAIAINMYLTDYDKFPPTEHRQEVIDYFDVGIEVHGSGDINNCDTPGDTSHGAAWAAEVANPYIKWPVVLDDYIKNRDIWRCPSAKLESGAEFIYNDGGNWLGYLKKYEGGWGRGLGVNDSDLGPVCGHFPLPSGWGGEITDSMVQGTTVSGGDATYNRKAAGAFVQSIGTMQENLMDVPVSAISNSSGAPVCADSPPTPDWLDAGRIAYANICCPTCSGAQWGCGDVGPTADCYGVDQACFDVHAHRPWSKDTNMRKASTRHLGGSNVGFADGHAKWYAAQAFLADVDEGKMEWIGFVCSDGSGGSSPEDYRLNCGGDPPASFSYLHSRAVNWQGKRVVP